MPYFNFPCLVFLGLKHGLIYRGLFYYRFSENCHFVILPRIVLSTAKSETFNDEQRRVLQNRMTLSIDGRELIEE